MGKRIDLEAVADLGGAALVQPLEPELNDLDRPGIRDAAIALSRFREARARFGRAGAEIQRSNRFSDAGKAAELGDLAMRELNELGRHDPILQRAQAALAELRDEARRVPLDLSPAQLALLPTIYAQLREFDPLVLPSVLDEAARVGDVLVLSACMSSPVTPSLRLPVSAAQLDRARELAAGPLPADRRALLDRLATLVDAAERTRAALVADLRRASGLERDALVELLGAAPKPANDPIAEMRRGTVEAA